MAKILIVGNARSPLCVSRGRVGLTAGHTLAWVSPHAARIPNIPVFSPGKLAAKWLPWRLAMMPWLCRRALSRFSPDLIHVHYAFQALQTRCLTRQKCPLVVTVMGGDVLPDQGATGISAYLARALLCRADAVTSKSEFLDSAIRRLVPGISPVRITWGVDLTCFRPHRRLESFQDRFNLPQHATVFLDCRAAQPLYNKHIIIRAFADLVARYSQLDLILLISEFNAVPRYLKQLHELVAALGLQAQVRFLPRLSEEDMADCYCAANATICVPSSDGFPQTVYEALACESALILGNLPQYEELPTSELPIQIVPVGDVPALSRAMATICQARDASPTTAAQGRAFVSRVADAAAESRKVNQLYGQLLNTAAAP